MWNGIIKANKGLLLWGAVRGVDNVDRKEKGVLKRFSVHLIKFREIIKKVLFSYSVERRSLMIPTESAPRKRATPARIIMLLCTEPTI